MARARNRTYALLVAACAAVLALAISGCTGGMRPAGDIPEPSGLSNETTETSIYYSTGRTLLQEKRVVDAENVYESTLTELLAATPQDNADVAIVQPRAEINSVNVADGVATVDWTASVLTFEADPSEERLALASILATLGQFPDIDTVRFTVEGETSGTIEGKDVEAFWVDVSLKGQPWAVIRISTEAPEDSGETSVSPETTITP